MFHQLKHQLKKQRERRQIHHATAHLSPHILRDIGLADAHRGLAQAQLTALRGW